MTGGVHVVIRALSKHYLKGGRRVEVLSNVDLEMRPGEKVAIVGASGSGKSTFLHMLGLLDGPTAGDVLLDGRSVRTMSGGAKSEVRNRRIGFVFQSHHLLPEHSALGNVTVPLRLAGMRPRPAEERAAALLRAVGLHDRSTHRPGELSGGEQQRVALARALVMGPGLVLADEPTGNLDPATAAGVFDLMIQLNEQLGSTLVVVTHSRELAARFPRRLLLADGAFQDLA
jgi:lipoprotein-releasing system ATP-binding protein